MDLHRGDPSHPSRHGGAHRPHRGAALKAGLLGGEWTSQHGPLVRRPDLGGRWVFPGRRLLVAGSWPNGVTEVWAHPTQILSGASLLLGGEPPATTAASASPVQLERELETPAGRSRELLTAAAAHAAAVWDVDAAAGTAIEAAWTVTLRAAGAPPASVEIERTAGGLRATSAFGAAEFILARGDALEHDGLRMWARGRGLLRVVLIAGADVAELDRNRERVERRGLGAIGGERAQHARLIADFATTVESDDSSSAAAFEWAKADADGLLVELPGPGRRFASSYRTPGTAAWHAEGPVVWAAADELVSLGGALLAAGLREPVRDAIRGGASLLEHAYGQWAGGGGTGTPVLVPEPPPPSACWAPLLREMTGFWGARASAGRRLDLAPAAGERSRAAVRRIRVGDAVLDAELHRRFDRVSVRLGRRHGPRLPVGLELRGPPPLGVTADDQPLATHRAVLLVADRHEVVFQF